jgi:glycosyltransferase involved in cell wall biosynthesis
VSVVVRRSKGVYFPADALIVKPRVSVVVPTYNRADIVTGAVDSALDQTDDDLEVIVVDDGSTDDTQAVLGQYDDEKRVTVLEHEANRGISAACNTGIEAAEDEFVCQFDDDHWRPAKVEKQVRRVEELGEEYGVVYTGGVVYRNDEEIGRYRPSKRGDLYPEILAEFGLAPHSSHMVRREAYESVGGFDTEFERGVEGEVSIRLARGGWELGYMDEALTEVYAHGGGDSRSSVHGVRS